jgi:large subunit ribosomal protein L21
MYAIIETGGKQYKIKVGDILNIELLDANVGDQIEIGKVLAIAKDDGLIVGTPQVEGAKAIVKVLEHGKDDKILVFKYKPKKNYRKIRGHRQPFTKVAVEKIVVQ